ncbi:MAG: flagellar motor switch protein FliG [Armatimonadetes bacterium]|nr:flagellar motor switch protein FliG [Armatimonadota bacterium]NIM24378.1 flagellar motor switch protein FliG [Armatimonadota bacterium]NIM68247.1 flagellar motor switch protein FliG [Armatimonadota bacterium]NIM75148.1 flagellar motor switch protein FliG [Armatimonadota bacterium]NIN06452.1 flagellar motor switch protein FliG [Armatimonadota bacterium]
MQQTATSLPELTNLQKAAVVLITLGPEKSAEILSLLDNDQVERIVREIARMDRLSDEAKRKVMEEFKARCEGLRKSDRGGIELAAELVRKALGPQRAAQIMEILKSGSEESDLVSLQKSEVSEIIRLIQDEHPQVIALVLSNLSGQKAASVLAALTEEMRVEVVRRIATSNPVMPSAASRLAKALEHKATSMRSEASDAEGGKPVLIEILKNADRSTERTVLNALSEQDPELAEFLREKLFVFEDLVKLEGKHLQLLIREVENEDLRVALRGAGDDLKEAIFQNMSEGAREALKEELETGQPVRLREVEAAQRKIAGVLRSMAEAGTIIMGDAQEEEYV